jgi:hypothetical protein
MGFTYTEAYLLPLWERKWFIERVQKEMKRANGDSRAAHANSADARAMMGRSRAQVPSKLRRFT